MKYLIIFSFLLFCQSKAYPQPVVSHFEVFFFDKDKPTKEYFGMYQEYPFPDRDNLDPIHLKNFFESIKKSPYCIVVKRLNAYYLQTYGWGVFGLAVRSYHFPYDSYFNKIDTNIKDGGTFNLEHTGGRDREIFIFEDIKNEPLMGFTGYVIPTKLLLQKRKKIKRAELMKFSFVLHYPKLSMSHKSNEERIKERSKKVGVSFKKGTHLQITMKTDETIIVEEDPLLDEYITFGF